MERLLFVAGIACVAYTLVELARLVRRARLADAPAANAIDLATGRRLEIRLDRRRGERRAHARRSADRRSRC